MQVQILLYKYGITVLKQRLQWRIEQNVKD